jgi:hypothetical protein
MVNGPTGSVLNLPIVGQMVKVHTGTVLAVFQCTCDTRNSVKMLRGVDQQTFCERCGNVFTITKIEFDASKGPNFNLSVTVVPRHLLPEAMLRMIDEQVAANRSRSN